MKKEELQKELKKAHEKIREMELEIDDLKDKPIRELEQLERKQEQEAYDLRKRFSEILGKIDHTCDISAFSHSGIVEPYTWTKIANEIGKLQGKLEYYREKEIPRDIPNEERFIKDDIND